MATFTNGIRNWRVQVRRKTRYVAETFRRRKEGEEWALEMERNIDRNKSAKPRTARDVPRVAIPSTCTTKTCTKTRSQRIMK